MSIDLNMDQDGASELLDLTNDVDSGEPQRKKGKLSNPLWNESFPRKRRREENVLQTLSICSQLSEKYPCRLQCG
jgi:hypothetical protein